MHPIFSEQLAKQRREALQREASAMRLSTNELQRKSAPVATPLQRSAFRHLWLGLSTWLRFRRHLTWHNGCAPANQCSCSVAPGDGWRLPDFSDHQRLEK